MAYAPAVRLLVEVEGEDTVRELPRGGAALVAFLSFAVSRGFGATHPLIALADRVAEAHRVPFGPLTTFYERAIEDEEDAVKLEHAWQPAGELSEAVSRLVAALRDDDQAGTLIRRAGAESLLAEAEALGAMLEAVDPARRVRLSYEL